MNKNTEKKLIHTSLLRLKDSTYKIIGIKESYPETLKEYLESLSKEIDGFIGKHIDFVQEEKILTTYVNTVNALKNNEYSHTECRKEVLKCLDILTKVIKRHFFEG